MLISKESLLESLSLSREREEPVVLSLVGKEVSFFTTILDIEDNWIVLRNTIPPELAPSVRHAQEFVLFCRSYKLVCSALQPFGVWLKFPIPEAAELSESRMDERIYFSARQKAWVEIQHPFDSATKLTRKVFDLSSGGFSFRARVLTPFIQPGRWLPSCQIYVDGELRENQTGQIVYVKQIVDLSGENYYQVGAKFVDSDGAGE